MSPEPERAVVEERPAPWRNWISHRLREARWSSIGLIAVIVLMVVTFSLLNPNFLSDVNIRNVSRQTAILGIVACGQTMVILSGGFDLSVGMAIGLISVAGSMVMSE